MGTRLILIRHGESILGKQRRYAGHSDTPLTQRGRRQILRLRQAFHRLKPTTIHSSDLDRCRETAALLAPDHRLRFSGRLREMDFGDWEGRTAAECARIQPARFERWMRRPEDVSPPRGETLREPARRVRAFVRDLARRHPGGTVALVTHAGPIRVLLNPRLTDFWKTEIPTASLREIEHPSSKGRKESA